MRIFFVISLLIAGLWALKRKTTMPTLTWFWPVVFLLPVPYLSYSEYNWQVQQHSYSAIASELAGHEVEVHCQRTLANLVDISGYRGYVPYPAHGLPKETYLRNDTCKDLASYKHNLVNPSLDEILAVHVLTHEIAHLRGVRDEAVAECEAMQRNGRTAELLGASPKDALELAQDYWSKIYPRTAPAYRTNACRPEGELDEQLPQAPW